MGSDNSTKRLVAQFNVSAIVMMADYARRADMFITMVEVASTHALERPGDYEAEALAFGWITASLGGLQRLPDALVDSVRLSTAVQVAEVVAQRVRERTYH